jgi:predicted PhzF superfamily epimerase YddE/YHI9
MNLIVCLIMVIFMSAPLSLYWVDAFTDKIFSGNPAAVIPLDAWLPDALLQQIAFENGLSETVYYVARDDGSFHIRWFTPRAEVDLCGHATLAAAFVLQKIQPSGGRKIGFSSLSGPLWVEAHDDGRLELDFPARPAVMMPTPAVISAGLGAEPAAFGQAEANLAVFDTAEQVLALRPRYELLATLPQYGTIATAPGIECDFVSRFFAPGLGVPEDPVTGSAHCTLTPYWAARLGKTTLHAKQISPRGGELWCQLTGDRVKIAGHAVLYLEAKLHLQA